MIDFPSIPVLPLPQKKKKKKSREFSPSPQGSQPVTLAWFDVPCATERGLRPGPVSSEPFSSPAKEQEKKVPPPPVAHPCRRG